MKPRKMIKKDEEENKVFDERWSNYLPQDILQMILTLLQLSDYQAFHHVCNSWRSAVKDGIATGSSPPAPQLPWLLLRSTDHSRYAFHIEPRIRTFIRDSNNTLISLSSSFSKTNCLGSVGSWLIMAAMPRVHNARADVINFMFNPLSGRRVMLPSQSTVSEYAPDVTYFKKAVASSAPPGEVDGGEPIVAALTSHDGVLMFCRPRDTSWTILVKTILTSKYRNIEIMGRRIFVYVKSRYIPMPMIMEFRISPKDGDIDLVDVVTRLPEIHEWRKWSCTTMVTDCETEELFVVMFRVAMKNQSSRNGLFRVFKLGPKPRNNEWKWEEVNDLGERMLFLSDKRNMVVRDESLGRNCIYFGFDIDFRGGYGVYSMESRKIKPLGFRKDSEPWNLFEVQDQTVWFEPHPWL